MSGVTFAVALVEELQAEATVWEDHGDGLTRMEIAFDRDGFAEWIIAALDEHGLAPVPTDGEGETDG